MRAARRVGVTRLSSLSSDPQIGCAGPRCPDLTPSPITFDIELSFLHSSSSAPPPPRPDLSPDRTRPDPRCIVSSMGPLHVHRARTLRLTVFTSAHPRRYKQMSRMDDERSYPHCTQVHGSPRPKFHATATHVHSQASLVADSRYVDLVHDAAGPSLLDDAVVQRAVEGARTRRGLASHVHAALATSVGDAQVGLVTRRARAALELAPSAAPVRLA